MQVKFAYTIIFPLEKDSTCGMFDMSRVGDWRWRAQTVSLGHDGWPIERTERGRDGRRGIIKNKEAANI